MGRIKMIKTIILISLLFSGMAMATQPPKDLRTLSDALLQSYIQGDDDVFYRQLHPLIGTVMGEASVRKLGKRKGISMHEKKGKIDSIRLLDKKTKEKPFSGPMKERFFPEIATFFHVIYEVKSGMNTTHKGMEYVKTDGQWYLVN